MLQIRSRGRASRAAIVLALPILLVTALGGDAEPQVSPPGDRQDPASYRISVSVDLVVLHASARDRKGRVVSDLREEHFEVYEDGIRQSIRLFRYEDTPVTVGLVVDHSGSMARKLTDVVAAARAFVQSSNPDDEMFVVNFNENVSLGLPKGIRFTNRSDDLERAISNVPATGRTALYDAVGEALERLQTANRDKKALIVISDGGDNASARSLDQVLWMAGQSSALVYTIGIFDEEDPDRNPGVLRRLARATGGEAFIPGHSGALAAVCQRIARDIRHQYTIGYVSTNLADSGAYRAIRVLAAEPGAGRLVVRARTGYFAVGKRGPVKGAQ